MPVLRVAALQVVGDGVPFFINGGVAFDLHHVDHPRFHAAAPGVHGDFPPVALHVHPGGQVQAALGHGAQLVRLGPGLQGVFVGALAGELPGFAQGFVHEELHGADLASLQRLQGILELDDDVRPRALRAVGRPHMHAQRARRIAGHALAVAPDAIGPVALAGAVAHPGARQGHAAGQVVGLGDGCMAVRADVVHCLGLAACPLEPVGQVLAAPDQRMLDAAVRAVDVKAHHALGVVARALDVAQALQARGAAAYELRVRRSLQAALGQAARVA